MVKYKCSYIILYLTFCLVLLSGCRANHTDKSTSSETVQLIGQKQQEKAQVKEKQIKGAYSNRLCGLISVADGSDLVVIDLESNAIEKIKHIAGVAENQAVALSPNGEMIAYSQYISENKTEGTYLIIENTKLNQREEFFKDTAANQLISTLQWLEDNETVVITMSLQDRGFYTDVLMSFNVKTKRLKIHDKGKFITGNQHLDYNNDLFYNGLSQEELDSIILKYGNSPTIPVAENGKWNYFELRHPSISPDGKKILYTISFYRNVTPSFKDSDLVKPKIWLASGLWVVDIEGGKLPYRIYGNPDTQCNTGKAVWSNDPKKVYFTRYYNSGSRGECGIEEFDVKLGNDKASTFVIERNTENDTNIPICVYQNELYFVSDGSNGSKNYKINLESKKLTPIELNYNNQNVLLWRFKMI